MVLPYGLRGKHLAEKNLLSTGGVTMFVKQIDEKEYLELRRRNFE